MHIAQVIGGIHEYTYQNMCKLHNMVDESHQIYPALDDALKALRETSAIKCAGSTAIHDENAISARLQDSVITEVAAFSESSNPEILPLLQQHLFELTAEILELLRGRPLGEQEFVRDFARRAAEQYFPLEPMLHVYRVCTKTLLVELTAGLLKSGERNQAQIIQPITEFLLEFFDSISILAAEHHVDQSRLLADVASDQRSELLSILLGGYDESDRRVSRILRDAGYLDRRTAFCVVLVQPIDPAEMHNPARARRLADHIDRLLQKIPGKRLVDIHRNKVTIVFSHLRRLSGWNAPQAPLAHRVARELLKIGTSARTGVSNDVASTAQVPAAYRQAALAFEVSNVADRVVQFADIPLQQLLYHFAGEDFARVLPTWATSLYDADERARGQLSQTLQAFADADMNVLAAAKKLRVHANTVYARFNKIAKITGRDPRRFHSLNELLIVASSRDQAALRQPAQA